MQSECATCDLYYMYSMHSIQSIINYSTNYELLCDRFESCFIPGNIHNLEGDIHNYWGYKYWMYYGKELCLFSDLNWTN